MKTGPGNWDDAAGRVATEVLSSLSGQLPQSHLQETPGTSNGTTHHDIVGSHWKVYHARLLSHVVPGAR